ncbi:MAG TPA: toll/interleukin-1 receptor domain-containing protein [Vicinamibacterales bacterium]|nr:toll/interleukin-1 receptor domain-containing protein [Vicinamibacterales bacterium]
MAHVFISYAKRNRSTAEELCAVLERSGIACWIAPRDIAPGTAWPAAILGAIADSCLMIIVVSRDAYRSRQMAREVERADNEGVPILPIRFDGTPLGGQLQFFLGNKQWLDFTSGSFDGRDAELLQAIQDLQVDPASRWADGDRALTRSSRGEGVAGPGSRRPPSLIQAAVDEVRTVVLTFVAVIVKRERALDDFDLDDPETLFFALRYLVYVSIVASVLHLPAWTAKSLQVGHPGFMVSVLAEDVIEKIGLCFVLYGVLRWLGGKGNLPAFVTAYCLLSTFQAMIAACLVPVHRFVVASQAQDPEELVKQGAAIAAQLSIWNAIVFLVSFAATTALWIVFFAALFRATRATHEMGAARTALSFALGIAAWIVVLFVFSQPFEAAMYSAYGPH